MSAANMPSTTIVQQAAALAVILLGRERSFTQPCDSWMHEKIPATACLRQQYKLLYRMLQVLVCFTAWVYDTLLYIGMLLHACLLQTCRCRCR